MSSGVKSRAERQRSRLRRLIVNPFFQQDRPLAAILRRHAWTMPIALCLGLVSTALEGISIGLLIPTISLITGNRYSRSGEYLKSALDSLKVQLEPSTLIILIALILFTLMLLKGIVTYVNQLFIAWVDGKVEHEIRTAVAQTLLQSRYEFFQSTDPSRLVNIVTNQARKASDVVRRIYIVLVNVSAILVFCGMLMLISWPLTVLVLTGAGLVRAIRGRLARNVKEFSAQQTGADSQLTKRMLTLIDASRAIRIFGEEVSEENKFARSSDELRKARYSLDRNVARLQPSLEVCQAALFLSIFVGAPMAGIPFPVLTAFLILLYRMQPNLRALDDARTKILAAAGHISEVEWLLQARAHHPEHTFGRTPPPLKTELRFDAVCYRHCGSGERTAALEEVTFTIPRGAIVALVGRSGSGKSTLTRLLCRLLEPSSGAIYADDVNIAEFDLREWRTRIGFAGQDLDLVEGTILDNIRFGCPGAEIASIREAAHLADAEEFIEQLPDKYETQVGRNGYSLSGGQRQRISIARAFLRQPEILVLDEATTGIDVVSERTIMNTIASRAGIYTTIIISHRLSTLELCDKSIIFAEGSCC